MVIDGIPEPEEQLLFPCDICNRLFEEKYLTVDEDTGEAYCPECEEKYLKID